MDRAYADASDGQDRSTEVAAVDLPQPEDAR